MKLINQKARPPQPGLHRSCSHFGFDGGQRGQPALEVSAKNYSLSAILSRNELPRVDRFVDLGTAVLAELDRLIDFEGDVVIHLSSSPFSFAPLVVALVRR
jgi:hypothetical protein